MSIRNGLRSPDANVSRQGPLPTSGPPGAAQSRAPRAPTYGLSAGIPPPRVTLSTLPFGISSRRELSFSSPQSVGTPISQPPSPVVMYKRLSAPNARSPALWFDAGEGMLSTMSWADPVATVVPSRVNLVTRLTGVAAGASPHESDLSKVQKR